MPADVDPSPIVVQGTEFLASDPSRVRRQKLARITLDSMVQFVGLLDAKGTVLEINAVALGAVGITLADVEGRPFWTTFWWQVSPEINATLRAMIERAAGGEFVRWDTDIYGRAGGKETIVIDASLAPVKDDAGNVVFICAEGRDITQKKAHEREIAQKNIELQGLLERIRELDEIKTQFFANVSHELRTPLALILGPAQRLIEDDGRLGVAERRECAEVIARSARMLLKHVNDLLDMSKLEAGKLKIELEDIDVAALVRFVASNFAVLASDRGIQFAIDASPSCVAAIDNDKLQRVVMNLLANAFKFVPNGGGVACAVQATGGELSISIDDSGPGVPPALRRAIFERFRQGDGSMSRQAGGTGLGLAIAKEFVEMHKGRIEVNDSPLGGARFQITLPLHRLHPDAVASATPAPRIDNGILAGVIEELRPPRSAPSDAAKVTRAERPKVLVVEDSPDMNRFIVQCLQDEYDVISAFDGQDGLEKALQFRPALVVSDIMMPHVSGVEMIDALRKLPELRDTPIMVLSAKADEDLMIKLLDEGAQDFVVKPFSEKILRVRVRTLVQAQEARHQVDALRISAESANRAKDEFMAMLGHELRNPLSPIVTALQLMKDNPHGHERARAVIERQVNHLLRLVDDLLDVSRIARGKVELKKEQVELAEVVAKAVEMVSPLFEERRHALQLDVAPSGLLVDADPVRLSQVITNLLTNAAKYMPPGGTIHVRAACSGETVSLAVRDSGIGISAEVLPQIFDLFVQEGQAIDRSRGGLGLGLAIVRNLVDAHGGTVTADSEGAGKGSEFLVTLPLVAAGPDRAARAVAAADSTGRANPTPTRVLVVDDNEDAATMVAAMLEHQGYAVQVAHDGPTALTLATEFSPDIALLDIGLPAMDGYELAAKLRATAGLSNVRLIALTGYGQETDRVKTRDAGFHRHLVKPVTLAVLEEVLNGN